MVDWSSEDRETNAHLEPGSFRDRHGRVYVFGERVFRGLSELAWRHWTLLADQPFTQRFTERGSLVATTAIDRESVPEELANSCWNGFLEHEKIPVVSYPYEWCFSMLRDAALLHLELLDAALRSNMTMKDGSAYNIQWWGVRPVFIDIASFEELSPQTPWTGYRQFCQLFLFPLMLQAYRGIGFHPWIRSQMDGIEVQEFWKLLSVRDLFRKGVFTHVFLHAKLQGAYSTSNRDLRGELKNAGFHKELILANVAGLRKTVEQLQIREKHSNWSEYTNNNSYDSVDRTTKEQFVRTVLEQHRWSTVWDLGCNTGVFSRIAAEHADYVIAMDSDHMSVDKFYRDLQANGPRNILPLVSNVVDPSPGLGWRLAERRPLHSRSNPELVFCLALIHHLVIGANVPLKDLIQWFESLGCDVVIEFVTKQDPMVQTLLRNKADIYDDYDIGKFERWMKQSFEVVKKLELTSQTRTLYYARTR